MIVTVPVAFVFALCLLPTRIVSKPAHLRAITPCRRLVMRMAAWSLGIRTVVEGETHLNRQGAYLVVANHQTYADIPVLGTCMGGHFISKAEIRWWPFVGWLACIGGTQFIHRKRAKRRHLQIQQIRDILANGVPLIGFPEGTTSDGTRIEPLHTGLFHAAREAGVPLLPVVVEYRRKDGTAMTHEELRDWAWFGDDHILPHMARTIAGRGVLAVVKPLRLLEPPHGERRELANTTRAALIENFGPLTVTE